MINYSFIIPVKEINNYIRELIPKILEINRDDYEIIIYPDIINSNFKKQKTQQIATGPIGPAEKRSLAMKDAKGKILIFLDDDAYPTKNFLNILEQDFNNPDIVAVGGPAITPSDDNFWQKVSGAVFLSSVAGGNPDRYISTGQKKFVDDWPSVNLSVRADAFNQINGFNSQYWPGEDTILCLDLIKKTHKKILYDPQLIAFHHRRSGFIRHLKQIGQYGLHRGFFAKKYPETSLKAKYFIPSLFLIFNFLFLIALIFNFFFNSEILKIFLISAIFCYIIYFLALIKAFFDMYKYEKNIFICLNALYYIVITHFIYGWQFIKGFIFTKKLKSRLRSNKLKN